MPYDGDYSIPAAIMEQIYQMDINCCYKLLFVLN